MEIRKEAAAESRGTPTAAQLASINAQAKATLTAEQVYVFALRLCDDRVDRDQERFDTQALPELARLFLGKTGILDHKWSSDNQVARIFATEVVKEETASYVKAWAYIRRGGAADEVIADIEAGIKKEVSVGCAMGRSVCSICGSDYGACGPLSLHVALPISFLLGLNWSTTERMSTQQAEYRALWKQAELGRQYEKELQDRVVRLSLSLELGVEEPVLRGMVQKAPPEDLLKLRDALEKRLAQWLPVQPQLPGTARILETVENDYLI